MRSSSLRVSGQSKISNFRTEVGVEQDITLCGQLESCSDKNDNDNVQTDPADIGVYNSLRVNVL